MKIGEIARRLGVSTRTLRFYEEQGLARPRRSDAGTRRYEVEDVERFAAILALTRLGISLEEIKSLAGARAQSRSGDEASREVFARLQAMREAFTRKRRELEIMEADLDQAQKLVRACFGCEQPPERAACEPCPVAARRGEIQIMKLVWEDGGQRTEDGGQKTEDSRQ